MPAMKLGRSEMGKEAEEVLIASTIPARLPARDLASPVVGDRMLVAVAPDFGGFWWFHFILSKSRSMELKN